jgi:hypothetical protein
MTKEDKLLVCKDICARLPYGLKVSFEGGKLIWSVESVSVEGDDIEVWIEGGNYPLESTKPFLRPMRSMTADEQKEWFECSHVEYDCEFKADATVSVDYCHLSVDWLNEHHFDYRGLIEKGLAVEAPKEMYNI